MFFFWNSSFYNSFGCNLSPNNVKHLNSTKYREFWKWFFLLYSLNQLFNRNCLIVGFQWSNWTIGWSFEVVLGGRNIYSIDTRLSMDGWTGQLSTNRTSFCSSLIKRLSTSWTHSSNNMLSIQLFFWLRYRQGKCFICLKHRGFLDFPITNKGNFSPTALALSTLSDAVCCVYYQRNFHSADIGAYLVERDKTSLIRRRCRSGGDSW